jgi:electron transfer flavoprotein alpha subunit
LGQEAIAYGADKVYVTEDSLLDQYNSDAYTQVVADLCRKVLPSIMLFGHTDIGCDLAPRLNGRLGGGLAMDCLALSVDPATKLLVSTRPVFGGNAHATMVSKSVRPQMATLRLKTVPPAERNDSRQGQILPVEGKVDPSALKVKVVERIKEVVEGVKLEDGFPIYDEGMSAGYFLKKKDGSTYVGLVWPGETVFPDFSRPEAREWFGSKYRMLAESGAADSSWIDMNEPSNCIYDA